MIEYFQEVCIFKKNVSWADGGCFCRSNRFLPHLSFKQVTSQLQRDNPTPPSRISTFLTGDAPPPGVGTYSPNTNTFNFAKARHAVWGPPPRGRPPSAPLRPRPEPYTEDRSKPKANSALPGATFKGKHFPGWPTDGPGPAYHPCCGDHCCDMCEKYKGYSFGIR